MSFIAVIPAAGAGTRLRPHTHSTPKALLPVAGKPILGHILDSVARAGPERVVLVVSPGAHGDRLREYAATRLDVPVRCVVQEEPLGLGHAIACARDEVRDRPMLIVLGDTILEAPFDKFVAAGSAIGVKAVDDPRRFGVATVKDGRVTRLVEKPERPVSNLALVGLYYLERSARLFEALGALERSGSTTRGEIQLTDALQRLIDDGEVLRAFPVEGWYDCGKTETLLETNRALLAASALPVEIPGVVILPPVAIDPSADVLHAVIGPHASIGARARVRYAFVRDSIVSPDAIVEDILLDGSVVGDHAIVRGAYQRLNVGNSSEVQSR